MIQIDVCFICLQLRDPDNRLSYARVILQWRSKMGQHLQSVIQLSFHKTPKDKVVVKVRNTSDYYLHFSKSLSFIAYKSKRNPKDER